MGINIPNFLISKSKKRKMIDFQDLDHIEGLTISAVSANLYNSNRDDLVMFYFREGANFASVYTQSKILSENIKWNLNQRTKKIFFFIDKYQKCEFIYRRKWIQKYAKNC